MLFHSLDYIVFLLIVFAAYWSLDASVAPWAKHLAHGSVLDRWLRSIRVALLLGASFVFYMSWNSVFLLLIIGSTLVDFCIGLTLGRTRNAGLRRMLVVLSLVANLGLLFLFKYADFAMIAASDTSRLFGLSFDPPLLRLILPVGISFYTFQTLSYTLDVYRRRIEPTDDLLEFATYVAFFPQLVAGPIVRAREFLPQFASPPKLSAAQAQTAIYLILRGLTKKVVVADVLGARLIDRVFDDPGAFSSAEAWVAVFAYTWQLYADFSGYTDVARGSARLFGFELPKNFDRPFDTTGPIEFWRRWHITLSSWVQDYVYIPLGGSKKGPVRTYINLVLTFLAIGIWHGAGWTFVLFGLWHAAGVSVNRLYRGFRVRLGLRAQPELSAMTRLPFLLLNLAFYVVHWPMFRSTSLTQMMDVYRTMFAWDMRSLRIDPWLWVVICGMAFLHFCPRHWVKHTERFLTQLPWPLMGFLVAVVAMLLMHVASGQTAPFIYFQF